MTVVTMLLFWVWFIVTGFVLAIVDIRCRRLPNAMVGLTFAVAITLLLLHGLVSHSLAQFRSAAVGAITLVLVYGALHVVGGIGMGDVKYAGVVGLYLGSLSWNALWWGTFLAFLSAAGVSVWAVSIQRKHRGQSIAFGPGMVAGALVGAIISINGG